jgi:hypothetical protein
MNSSRYADLRSLRQSCDTIRKGTKAWRMAGGSIRQAWQRRTSSSLGTRYEESLLGFCLDMLYVFAM